MALSLALRSSMRLTLRNLGLSQRVCLSVSVSVCVCVSVCTALFMSRDEVRPAQWSQVLVHNARPVQYASLYASGDVPHRAHFWRTN